jgi:hypothetical protein
MMEINPFFALCVAAWLILPPISLVLSLVALLRAGKAIDIATRRLRGE